MALKMTHKFLKNSGAFVYPKGYSAINGCVIYNHVDNLVWVKCKVIFKAINMWRVEEENGTQHNIPKNQVKEL
ncbi:MAG TPA: hypothetical protein VMV86_05825 [Methanosarcinales archaeon]|nr:hypothetical protein [Methanosarcinales archaeon]